MSLLPFCRWLAETPGSIALRESLYMYPLVESVHVLTLCVFVGMTIMLDLRLLGVTLRRVRVSEVAGRLVPWMGAGFVVMFISGVLLFYAIPVRSYQSVWFRGKAIMLILAGVNAWTFHSGVYKKVAEWDLSEIAPRAARRAGLASLILWAAIVVFGRMMAYNWFDCDKPQPSVIVWLAGCTGHDSH
ncbi:MAG: hypothetical protein HY047_13215 [Acidobacteria bacterium]|nr:hypothetical protein [Acidobacteriota bacterium]